MSLSTPQVLTLAIALLTLAGVAFGRLPLTRLSRAGIALLGASLLLLTGVLDLPAAWRLIDGDIIVLLFALMVVNAFLTTVGFFRLLTRWAVSAARSTLALLTLLVFSSGLLSAFFLNDTIVLMLTPLVLAVTRELKRPPVPYLLALALAANVGSAAALTGNPQNLVVGLRGNLGFLEFLLALGPPSLLGLFVVIAVLYLAYPREFRAVRLRAVRLEPLETDRWRLALAVCVTLGMLAAFVLGANVPTAALVAAALLLLLGRKASDELLRQVDWTLLVLFAGLFVVVGALETSGLSALALAGLEPLLRAGTTALALLTLVLSNLLSNVPAVLLLVPVLEALNEGPRAWLTLAMASTFAGNLTLIGSVANLIVAEQARRQGVELGFWAYARVGVPVTLLTMLLGVGWLVWLH